MLPTENVQLSAVPFSKENDMKNKKTQFRFNAAGALFARGDAWMTKTAWKPEDHEKMKRHNINPICLIRWGVRKTRKYELGQKLNWEERMEICVSVFMKIFPLWEPEKKNLATFYIFCLDRSFRKVITSRNYRKDEVKKYLMTINKKDNNVALPEIHDECQFEKLLNLDVDADERTKLCMRLHFKEDMNYSQIGKVIGVSKAMIGRIILECLNRIKIHYAMEMSA